MKNFSVIFLCALFLFGCKKEPIKTTDPQQTQTTTEPKVKYINITDALSLAKLKTGNTSTNNLYKISTSGSYSEVIYLDENKNPIDVSACECIMYVSNIFNVNDDYFVLLGNFSVHVKGGGYPLSMNSFLVRKSDGAIFEFGDYMFSSGSTKIGDDVFQKDSLGNIYYNSFGGVVYKIDISNPSSIKRTTVIASGQQANYFNMEKNGYFIYEYSNNNTSADLRIQKTNGGIYPINIVNRNNKDFWLNSKGDIFFVTLGTNAQIHKVDFTGGNVVIDTLWRSKNDTLKYTVGAMFRSWSQGSYLIRKANSVVFVDTYNDKHFEFFETDSSVKAFSLPKLTDYDSKITASENYYYIGNGFDLYKASLVDNSYTKLTNTGDYEIYCMSVSKDDVLHLSALKLSNGKNIIAEINASGQLTIIDENVNKVGEAMVRIR